MRNKFNTLIVVCGLAVAVCTSAGLACDKDAAVQCNAHRTTKTKVLEVQSGCSKSSQGSKAGVVAASDKGACCPVTGKPVTMQASAVQGCPAEQVMKNLAMALMAMNEHGAADAPGREHVVAAMRVMTESKPDLACDTVTKLLASESSCGSAKTVVASAGGASQCGSAKTVQASAGKAACDPSACSTQTKVLAVGNKTCDPSACSTQGKTVAAGNKACDPSACSTKGKVVAAAAGNCCSGGGCCAGAKKASYVAFNCEKTDRLARALANAYLDLMREVKLTAGADGCAAKTASKVLASVIDEMSAEQTAATGESVEVEVVPVSLGAVGEKSKATKSSCGASRN
jgi:hypothetical protein